MRESGRSQLIGRRAMRLERTKPPRHAYLWLAVFFVMGGCCQLSQEMFKHLCQPDDRFVFILLTFGISGVASLVVLAVRRRRLTAGDVGAGIALGTASLVHAYCMLKALESLPGYVAFPMASSGSLLFTTAVAVCFLEERLSRLNIAGITIPICSLGLLHSATGPNPETSPSRSADRETIRVGERTSFYPSTRAARRAAVNQSDHRRHRQAAHVATRGSETSLKRRETVSLALHGLDEIRPFDRLPVLTLSYVHGTESAASL